MYCRQLGMYINHPTTKYVVLDDGMEIKRSDISEEDYEFLQYFGYIVREFER